MKSRRPIKAGYYVPRELKQVLPRLMEKFEMRNGWVNWKELFALNPHLFDCFPGKTALQIHKYALDLRRKRRWTPKERARAVRVVQRWRERTKPKHSRGITIGSTTSGELAKDLKTIRRELGLSIADVLRYGADRLLKKIKKHSAL